MYLSEVYAENFRVFGAEEDGRHLCLALNPGLNVLVGENDSGKSAIIDAIRYTLWTTTLEFHRFSEDDFHIVGSSQATSLTLRCRFAALSVSEQAKFLEWLSLENQTACLYVTVKAAWIGDDSGGGRSRISVKSRSGMNGEGPPIEGDIREFLRTTYLRPLRDAEGELSPGRNSRLSQILQSHPRFKEQEDDDFDRDNPDTATTLAGILSRTDYEIRSNTFVGLVRDDINTRYLREFSVGEDVLVSEIDVGRRTELRYVLEKLELWLRPRPGVDIRTRRGLGANNVLFMATELLLLAGEGQDVLPLLLIEEPEAHLHPQLQLRLMKFLQERSTEGQDREVQILLTTHSPNLASSVGLCKMTLVHDGLTYPLSSTRLNPLDYRFLERFLDVTKANLFFAKGVVIVEGDAENILLPVAAKCIGRSFSRNGVSIVNVGSRGLFRYSRIFQRVGGADLPIRVACIADRDVVPDVVDYAGDSRKEAAYGTGEIDEIANALQHDDSTYVRTFISPKWTLEYDIAYCGFNKRLDYAMHLSVQLAKKQKGRDGRGNPIGLSEAEVRQVKVCAWRELNRWKRDGLGAEEVAARIYEPLKRRQASKAVAAQFLAEYLDSLSLSEERMRSRLPPYLVHAIDHVTGNSADE